MDKKILVGSIIAVAILVLVSFTGVVGYQTTSTTLARASPLFSVRSKRAIDRDSKDIACDYVGKGEATNIQFSSKMKRTEQVQKTIDIISKMDDKAFRNLVPRIILNLKNREQMTDTETSDVLQALFYIRENPNDINYFDTKDTPLDTNEFLSCRVPWFLPCKILMILSGIFNNLFVFILGRLTHLFGCFPATSVGACPTVACPL